VVGGADPENVAVQGFVVNSHTSAMDLSVFGFNPVEISAAKSAVRKEISRPGLAKLFSGSPNPTGGGIVFSLHLTQPVTVTLDIYSIDGRRVATAYQGRVASGAQKLVWNGRTAGGVPVAPGNYFARLNSPEGALMERLVVIR
jgi:hypothetical protein